MEETDFPDWFVAKYQSEIKDYIEYKKKTWVRIADVMRLQDKYIYDLQVLKNRLNSYEAKIKMYEERLKRLEAKINNVNGRYDLL